MFVRPIITNIVSVSLLVLVSGCAITQPHDINEAEQTAALQRWQQCIESNRVGFAGNAIDAHQAISLRCEGHHRDVLATYPKHMENQVDSLLSQRSTKLSTEHFLRSSNVMPWKKP